MSSSLAFVEQLEIAPSTDFQVHVSSSAGVQLSAGKEQGFVKLSADKEQGFVNAGSLVSFVSGISEQNREDVLNSTLLAQLAADKKHNRSRETDTDKWYDYFKMVLSKIGWVVQEFQFEQYQSHGQTLKVASTILDVIRGIVSGKELEAVERTIQSLQTSEKEPWWEVFSRKSSGPSTNGNFQVLPCKQDESDQVVMSVGAFYFSAKTTQTRWLWFNYSSADISVYKGMQTSTLNKSVYDQVREAIIKKLGDNATKFIGDLDI